MSSRYGRRYLSFIRGSRYRTVLAMLANSVYSVLGNLHAVALAQFHHDVEEVHAVQFELVAERHVLLQLAEVLVGRDVGEDVETSCYGFALVIVRQPSWRQLSRLTQIRLHNHHRIDSQHAERVVQDGVDPAGLPRLVGHQAGQRALRDRAGRG